MKELGEHRCKRALDGRSFGGKAPRRKQKQQEPQHHTRLYVVVQPFLEPIDRSLLAPVPGAVLRWCIVAVWRTSARRRRSRAMD